MRIAALLTIPLLAAGAASAGQEARSFLQYDALLVGDGPAPRGAMPYALFLRYYLLDEGFAAEVLHFEPRWNVHGFAWTPVGLAFYSDGDRFTVIQRLRDREHTVRKPVGERGPVSLWDYEPTDLAHAEEAFMDSAEALREALEIGTAAGAPIEVERKDGRVVSVTWELAEDAVAAGVPDLDPTRERLEYKYGGGGIERMTLHAPPRQVPRDQASRGGSLGGRGLYLLRNDGGRITDIHFEDVSLDGRTLRLPVSIKTRQHETGAVLRSKQHGNFRMRTLAAGETPPWERWAYSGFSPVEQARRDLLQAHADRDDKEAHRDEFEAALREFIVPLYRIESDHGSPALQLRAFYHSYHSAAVVNDEGYLLDGFQWYMDKLVELDIPRIVVHAGQDTIRRLHRMGHDNAAERAVQTWLAAVRGLEGAHAERVMDRFAEHGPAYFVYRAFDTDGETALEPGERFERHFWRCMALKRFGGQQPLPENRAQFGPDWWEEMNWHDWLDLVELAVMEAEESFEAIGEPSIPQRRLMYRIETFHEEAREGRIFPPPGS